MTPKPKELKTNSKSGIPTMRGKTITPLSSQEICEILVVSAKAGVSELKFRDLHVSFGRPAEQVSVDPHFVQHAISIPPVKDLTETQHAQLKKDSLESDEILVREEQLARALVEDPERYEELLRDGELSDGVDTSDESEE